jgi:hypothetical protein
MASNTASRSSSVSSSTTAVLSSSGRELLLDLKRSSGAPSSSSPHQLPVLPTYNTKLVQACFRDLYGSIQALDLQVQALSNREQDRRQWQQQQQAGRNSPPENDHEASDGEDDDDDDKNGSDNKPSMAARPSILLLNATIQRYKRCLLAYHYHRMNILKDIQRLQPPVGGGAVGTAISIISTPEIGGGGSVFNSGSDGNSSNVVVSANAQEVAFAQAYAALRAAYSTEVFDLGLLPPTSHMVQVRVVREVGRVVLPDSGRAVTLTRGACLFAERADVQDFLLQGVVQIYDGEEVDF